MDSSQRVLQRQVEIFFKIENTKLFEKLKRKELLEKAVNVETYE